MTSAAHAHSGHTLPITRTGYPPSDTNNILLHGMQSSKSESEPGLVLEAPGIISRLRSRCVRISRLLVLGYASEEEQRKYELQEDWTRFHSTLQRKLENVGIVSGLLLTSNTNLLISGELHRFTYTTVAASIFSSLVSLLFDFICLWSIIGAHPTRLKHLVRNDALFYYLYGTPSLFGGASAIAFFIAIGAWTWLDQADAERGLGGKVCSTLLGCVLAGNACICFYLGGSVRYMKDAPPPTNAEEHSTPIITMPVPQLHYMPAPKSGTSLDPTNLPENFIPDIATANHRVKHVSESAFAIYQDIRTESLAVPDLNKNLNAIEGSTTVSTGAELHLTLTSS